SRRRRHKSFTRDWSSDVCSSDLFTQLTVSKSPSASMLEGGAAGTVNMRSARPFDREGLNVTYTAQAMNNDNADDLGGRVALVASNTWDTFGVLVGVAAVRNKVETSGFETIGWTNPGLTEAQCGGPDVECNTTGGGNWAIPSTVPSNAGNGLTP